MEKIALFAERLPAGLLAACLTLTAAPAFAQDDELPPIPASLLQTAGAVCVGIAKSGRVSGAYVLASTGNADADRDMLGWAQELRWPAATSGAQKQDKWLPVPIAFGDKDLPFIPAECAAPTNKR